MISGPVVTGWGAVCAAGVGTAAVARALAVGVHPPRDASGLYPEELPAPLAYACLELDPKALLGRKGTSFLDRATALAMVACGQAIAHSGLRVDDQTRGRIGLALGTTVGSFRSSSDYSRETRVQDRPYLVNPVLFPNTVMNCAAGQSAIRYGLKGVNSTIAGGSVAFLGALRYADNVLRLGYADAMLVGAVEEFTPHRAWLHRRLGRDGLPGEAAAVFVLSTAAAGGAPPSAEVAAVTTGYCPGGGTAGVGAGLAGCIRRALDRAGVRPEEVTRLATGELTDPGAGEVEAAAAKLVFEDARVQRLAVTDRLGDCGAATGALHLAALLCGPEVGTTVLAGWSPEGAVAAAVVRSGHRCPY